MRNTMNFTKSQKLAIELQNRNILVSAAAGSGKTATLTQRIISLLTDPNDPTDINTMLIVTFTRAAAGELKTRISRVLTEYLAANPTNRHIANQLTSLGGAKICTIDSYYLDLIRTNFQKLGLAAKFRLADETELALIRDLSMNYVIEKKYREDANFVKLADQFATAKGENKLSDIFLDIAKKIQLTPHGTEYLSECAQRYKSDSELELFCTTIGQVMRNSLKDELLYLLKCTDRLLYLIDQTEGASVYGEAISSDRDYINWLLTDIDNIEYKDFREKVYAYSASPLKRISSSNKSNVTEEIKNERNKIKDRLLELSEREFFLHPDDNKVLCQISADYCLIIKDIIDNYNSVYSSEKEERNICEFADLRKYALELLIDENGCPSEIAKEEQKKYTHIFVDEYQDTDSIQDLVFTTISNGHNLFLVGDIKQSIYGFRGANPSVFSKYRKQYLPAEGRTTIPDIPLSVFMSENFRCSPNIISFTNSVCSYLFRETDGPNHGIGYVSEDDLIASRSNPISDDKVKIVFLENTNESNDDKTDIEAKYIISEIKDILNNRTLPNGEKYRASDIAILTRSNKEAMNISQVLAREGIPHANGAGNDLFENPEVLLMLSLMSAIDNYQRDVPLAGALRSPIFNFTMSDLLSVKNNRDSMSLYDAILDYLSSEDQNRLLSEKCKYAIRKLDDYRAEAEAMPVHIFIRHLWKDTNALSYAGAEDQSNNRSPIEKRRNLRKFYEYARKFEASSFKGLHQFIEYINSIIDRNTKITYEDAVTNDTVQVMTVHKSKGLEFPVVFLAGCDNAIIDQDSKKPVLFTTLSNMGLACKIPDSTGESELENPFKITISKMIAEQSAEEEIRILYVALTRARDNLYVIASGNKGFAEKRINSAINKSYIGGRNTIIATNRWIERILTALYADPNNDSYEIITKDYSDFSCSISTDDTSKLIDESEINNIYNLLIPSLSFKYKYIEKTDIPSKISVSKLYPELFNDDQESTSLLAKIQNTETKKPRFLSTTNNPTEQGIATHLFLQFCDYLNLQPNDASVSNEIARLLDSKFISSDIANLINKKEIISFIKSDLFKELKSAKKIYREFRFNVFLNAALFATQDSQINKLSDSKVLVQGVIDLCYINSNNELILCDYKTDRIPRDIIKNKQYVEEFFNKKHAKQLYYYYQAVSQIMDRSPDRTCIYSLAFGDIININF